MTADAAIQFILSQTRQNVEFLLKEKAISDRDADEILSRLPQSSSQSSAPSWPSAVPVQEPAGEYYHEKAEPPRAEVAPSYLFKAKATWGYNEDNTDPNDLTFHAGDVIEVTAETNADWWSGRCNGNEGLFPSAYVKKVPPPPPPPAFPRGTGGPAYSPAPYHHTPASYGQSQPPYQPPPQQYGQGHPEEQPAEPKKESSGLKNTLAHSAVGGVGFGAGAAVAGGIISSIF